jgi:uncharacterized protein (DUF433 family)
MIAMPATLNVPLWTDEHGKIRVDGTHVLLELVIHAFQRGEIAEDIVDSYPNLRLAAVYAVLAYYLAHRADVDAYVQQVDKQADRIQREVEAAYTPGTLDLLARLRAQRDRE